MDDSLPSSHLLAFERALDPWLPLEVEKRSPTEKKVILDKINKFKESSLTKRSIYERFIKEGILKLITLEDFISNWRYIGGTRNHNDIDDDKLTEGKLKHEKYLLRIHKINWYDIDCNYLKDHCVCGTPIQQRIFISDGKKVITIGNECVITFFEEECKKDIDKLCTGCKKVYHRNRIGTLCNVCKDVRYKPATVYPKAVYPKAVYKEYNVGRSIITSYGSPNADPNAYLKKDSTFNVEDYLLSKYIK